MIVRRRLHNLLHPCWRPVDRILSSPAKSVLLASAFFTTSVVLFFLVGQNNIAHAGGVLDSVINGLSLGVAHLTFSISNLLLRLTLFALQLFIALASYNAFSTSPVVEAGWVLMRDVANMFFIVAMLVIAFATVLGVESYAMKRTLGKLLLMAVLVNFSKLIAQLIIDVAHVFSMTFINAISATAGGNIINMLKLSSIREAAVEAGAISRTGEIAVELMLTGLFAVGFAATAMFVMAMYMVVIIWRTIQLWILMILSPIAFSLQALPATAKYAKEWWSDFTKYVVSLPIMVFFLWLAFATLSSGEVLSSIPGLDSSLGQDAATVSGDTARGGNGIAALTLAAASTWTDFAGFLIVIGFLLGGLEQVQKLGVRGADGKIAGLDVGGLAKKALYIGTGAFVAKKGLDAGKDYAKLASNRIGLHKIPLLGSQSAGKLRREAALKKMEEEQELRKTRIKADGPRGLAKILAPSTDRLAKETVATDDATRASTARKTIAESAIRRDRAAAQREGEDGYFSQVRLTTDRLLEQEKEKLGRDLTQDEEYEIKERVAFDLAQEFGGEIGLAALEAQADTDKRDAASRAKFLSGQYVTDHVVRNRDTFDKLVEQRSKARANELGVAELPEKELAKIQQEVATELGGEVFSSLIEADAEAKTKKGEGEAKKLKNVTSDALRILDNKLPEKVRDSEEADYKERVGEWSRLDFDDRSKRIKEQERLIAAEMAKPEKDRNKKVLEKASQNLAYAMTSAFEQGEADIHLAGLLSQDEKDFMDRNGMYLTDPEVFQQVFMAKMTGNKVDKKFNTAEMASMQKDFNKRLKDKRGGAMRGLRKATETSAKTKSHHKHIIQSAFDENGLERLTIGGAVSASTAPVTGGFASNRVDDKGRALSGEALRKQKYDYIMSIKKSLADVGNGAGTIVHTRGDGKAARVTDKGKRLYRSISQLSASQILNMDQGLANFTTGGSESASSFDATHGTQGGFVLDRNMVGEFNGLMKDFIDEYNRSARGPSANANEQKKREQALVAYISKVTGKKMTLSQISQLTINGNDRVFKQLIP